MSRQDGEPRIPPLLGLLGAIMIFAAGCGSQGATKARLIALNAVTGGTRWMKETDAIFIDSATVRDRKLLLWGTFEDKQGCIGGFEPFALDAATGQAASLVANAGAPPDLPRNGLSFHLSLPNGVKVETTNSGGIAALAGGRTLWRRRLPRARFHFDPMPIFAGAGIIVAFPNAEATLSSAFGDTETSLVALDARTGRTLWQLPPRAGEIPLPAFGRRTVYAFDDSHQLEAIEASNGSVRWRADVPQGGITLSRPIIVSSRGRVTALTAKGRPLWAVRVPSGTALHPATVAGETVYVPIEGATGSGCGD
jgi:outer membrane protein assembly factor BamB